MCGMYYVNQKYKKAMEALADETDAKIRSFQADRDIHPTDHAPILIRKEDNILLTGRKWGFPGPQGKGMIFNARAESVLEKRMFQNGVRYHRAVIPATHFYEWNANREKNIFSREDEKPLLLAGFYDLMANEERFVILTTQANASMVKVHDRMPLILEEEQVADWIMEPECTEEILKQVPVLLKREAMYEQMRLL